MTSRILWLFKEAPLKIRHRLLVLLLAEVIDAHVEERGLIVGLIGQALLERDLCIRMLAAAHLGGAQPDEGNNILRLSAQHFLIELCRIAQVVPLEGLIGFGEQGLSRVSLGGWSGSGGR